MKSTEEFKWVALIISLVVDGVGLASIWLGFTEFLDLIWAPLSAGIIQYLYNDYTWSAIGFTEELFPGTDVVPTATFAWIDNMVLNKQPMVTAQ